MHEIPYYSVVENWLMTRGGCFAVGKNYGTKLARADVVGVRHTGGDLSTDYELVAVVLEVGDMEGDSGAATTEHARMVVAITHSPSSDTR